MHYAPSQLIDTRPPLRQVKFGVGQDNQGLEIDEHPAQKKTPSPKARAFLHFKQTHEITRGRVRL